MAQASENIRCLVLGEFVDDASKAPKKPKADGLPARPYRLHELVNRIAAETSVPPYQLIEVVEKVLAAMMPQIEEKVRRELQQATENGQQDDPRRVTG